MHKIYLVTLIGVLSVIGCKERSNEAKSSNGSTEQAVSPNKETVKHLDATFPLYEDRLFTLEKEYPNSKIDFAHIKKLKPWDENLLLKLFVPVTGENTVYTYKTKYSIPKNIDEAEGDYEEYLIVEVDPMGEVVESLLYEGGPKQGPIFWNLFRGSKPKISIKHLSDLSQLNLPSSFPSHDDDLRYRGTGRIE